ncbi:MAG: CPBP family intramembrane metalloprotease [Treponema sp.]|nr:CPBP family intramembrane metalloprotease [Treponema sp.]
MEKKVYPALKNSIFLCLLLLGIQIVFFYSYPILLHAFDLSNNSFLNDIMTILGALISFGMVLCIGLGKTKKTFNEVFKFNGITPALWIATVIFTVGLIILIPIPNNVIRIFIPTQPISESFKEGFDSTVKSSFTLAVITIVIIAPIAEELLFRGLILDGLKNNYSKRKAIIISSLLFGAIHFNLQQFTSAFIIGLFAAWICINTNSILLCIFIHFFNNILYTITVRYGSIIPMTEDYQRLLYLLAGIVLFISGIILLKKEFGKAKIAPDGFLNTQRLLTVQASFE